MYLSEHTIPSCAGRQLSCNVHKGNEIESQSFIPQPLLTIEPLTMADKFADLKKKYEHQVPANALILNLAGHKALRVECPTIGKE